MLAIQGSYGCGQAVLACAECGGGVSGVCVGGSGRDGDGRWYA